jgi:D-glycero-alpha-D-manno-heptose 1-phosphate guanylyltransferase
MDAIILAGGLGTRLKHLFPDLPKPLVPICGIPFLEVFLSYLDKQQIFSRVIISSYYQAEKIQETLKNKKFSFEIVYSIEPSPLGTGGAILFSLQKAQSSSVFVFNGDCYTEISLKEMRKFHQQKKADLTIAYREDPRRDRYGSLEIESSSQRIVAFLEKQSFVQEGHMNAGVYVVNKEIFQKSSFSGTFSIEKEGFPFFIKEKKVFGFYYEGLFIDIGTEESYLTAQTLLQPIASLL